MPDELDELCARVLAEHGCASVSVAVAEGDEVVLARAYGFADVASRRPATPGTVYGLASVTKAFTATAVCLAADEGLLDLDAPASGAYGPTGPTPRQLLLHRGGFPAFYTFHYGAGPLPIEIERYRAPLREPGTAFEYSNTGYQDLGRLLESATGRPLGDHLRERVAAPLGLSDFAFGAAYTGPGPVATRYSAGGHAYPTCRTGHPAATAGWATAADVALFARTASRLLKPSTLAAMNEAPAINEHTGYGYGRLVSHGPGPVVHSHGGGMGGIAAMMIDVPERELSLAVLTNSTDKAARDAVVRHLAGALLPGFRPTQLDTAAETPRTVTLPQGTWSGEITTPEGGLPLRLRLLSPTRLEVQLADAPPVTTAAAASDRWDLRATAALQLPTRDARLNSPHLGLELRLREDTLTGRAIAYKPGDQEGFLGSYLPHPCTLR
ncbi:serine hydrolase domain-containing protein [Kitasatospora sp. NPDC001664]